jgi:hypothetical protein
LKASTNEDFKLIAIKTKDRVYISDNITNSSYFNSQIKYFLFDETEAKSTYKSDWYEVSAIPNKIEKRIPKQVIKSWYELKEAHYNTSLPRVLYSKDFAEDGEYESVYGLYQIKNEYDEGGLESIKFQLNVIEELDDFVITRSDYELQHPILDKIQTHPILLTTKHCSLSREDSYKIVRKYIKENINHKYATITSDYDFCFTVAKKIDHDPEPYQVNVGKRKPKYETRYQRTRTVKTYEIAPKAYQNYPVIEPFQGKNEQDLKNNIQSYLDEVMAVINKPLVECEHCKGLGVVKTNEI